MLPGDDLHEAIEHGIRNWDKVLLCCSENSLTSWWVDNEIDKAFAKEQALMKERKNKVWSLIPIDLDGYLFEGWTSGKSSQVVWRPTFKAGRRAARDLTPRLKRSFTLSAQMSMRGKNRRHRGFKSTSSRVSCPKTGCYLASNSIQLSDNWLI